MVSTRQMTTTTTGPGVSCPSEENVDTSAAAALINNPHTSTSIITRYNSSSNSSNSNCNSSNNNFNAAINVATSTLVTNSSSIINNSSSSKQISDGIALRATTKFMDLPVEILHKIFSYVGHKNVAHARLVSNF